MSMEKKTAEKVEKTSKKTSKKTVEKKKEKKSEAKSIFFDAKPYLWVSAGLLCFLFIQTNWKNFNFFKSNTTKTVAASTATQVVTTHSVENPDKAPKESKIDRLKGFFGGKKGATHSAEENVHWGYGPTDGPDKWGDLTAAYGSCKTGKAQSPIDLTTAVLQNGFQPLFYYKATKGEIVNNGHTLQVNVQPGSFLRIVGKDYQLKQFHFHVMAEHRVDGRRYPMSVHLVHESDEGHIVVVALLIEPGEDDKEYNMLIDRLPLPEIVGSKIAIAGMEVDPAQMLPARYNRSYFTYDGSLTTPPCTENVGWIVMKTTIRATMNRINRIGLIMKSNFRPPQKLNGRSVMYGH